MDSKSIRLKTRTGNTQPNNSGMGRAQNTEQQPGWAEGRQTKFYSDDDDGGY